MKRQPYGYDGGRFVAYWWFVGWWALSLGMHISFRDPNIEVHLPFGFLRIGFVAPRRARSFHSPKEPGPAGGGE